MMYPSDKRPRLYASGAAKKREKKRRLDNAVAGTSKIRSFFVTTTAGEDETSEGIQDNSKRDAVDVAPSVPAPEDEAAAEPASDNEAPTVPTTAEPSSAEPAMAEPATARPTTAEPTTAEPTMAEPARCGSEVQEFSRHDARQPDGSCSLSTGQIANQTENDNYSSRSMSPKRTVCCQQREWKQTYVLRKALPCTFWGNGNRTAMAMLLANDEEAILSKLLVVRRSIGNAERVGQRCVGQPEELRSEYQSAREDPIAP